jgi:chromosome segregation ATPase
MSDCPDHGSDESPWMCVCTDEKIARLAAAEAKVKGLADQLEYWRPHAIELEANIREWKKEAAFVRNLYDIANAKVTELEAEIERMKDERNQNGMEKDLNT